MSWKNIVPVVGEDLWELSKRAEAVYECPLDTSGKRVGPLVPYAGKDELGRNFVGEAYFNFGEVEPYLQLVAAFARKIWYQVEAKVLSGELEKPTTVVGIPDGGRTLGQMLAYNSGLRFVYPTKVAKIAQVEGGPKKDEYDLVFTRSTLSAADKVLVCDDVHNNFKNIRITLDAIWATGAGIAGLCSGLNRSVKYDDVYQYEQEGTSPLNVAIFTAIRKPLPEYRQDDLAVAADMAAGNIEWHAKKNWARLKKAMDDAEAAAKGR